MQESELQVIDWLRKRLAEPLPGTAAHELMAARVRPMPLVIPYDARPSAVLASIFFHRDQLHTLMIKRTEDGKAHSGQVSFPGGRQERSDADLAATALREAYEEVGIRPADVEILGGLTPLYIPVSNFLVHPFIGYMNKRPSYRLNDKEVARVIEIPLRELLHPDRKTQIEVTSPADKSFIRTVPAYTLPDGTIIWGATAMMFSEFQVLFGEYE